MKYVPNKWKGIVDAMVTITDKDEYVVNKNYLIKKGFSLLLNKYISESFDALVLANDMYHVGDETAVELMAKRNLTDEYELLRSAIGIYKGGEETLRRKTRSKKPTTAIRHYFGDLLSSLNGLDEDRYKLAYWLMTTRLLMDFLGIKPMDNVSIPDILLAYQGKNAGNHIGVDEVEQMLNFVKNSRTKIIELADKIDFCVKQNISDIVAKEALCTYTSKVIKDISVYDVELDFLDNVSKAEEGIYGLNKDIAHMIARAIHRDYGIRLHSQREILREIYYNIIPDICSVYHEGRLSITIPAYLGANNSPLDEVENDPDGVSIFLKHKIINDYLFFARTYTGLGRDQLLATRFSDVHYSKFKSKATIEDASEWVRNSITDTQEWSVAISEAVEDVLSEGISKEQFDMVCKLMVACVSHFTASWIYRHAYNSIIFKSMQMMGTADTTNVFNEEKKKYIENTYNDARFVTFILRTLSDDDNDYTKSQELRAPLEEMMFTCKTIACEKLYEVFKKDTDLYFTLIKPLPSVRDSNFKIASKEMMAVVVERIKDYFPHPTMEYDVLSEDECTSTAKVIIDLIFESKYCKFGMLKSLDPNFDDAPRDSILHSYRLMQPLGAEITDDDIPHHINNKEDIEKLKKFILSSPQRFRIFIDLITMTLKGEGIDTPFAF
jgi:hypothetical protein